jgi:short-subunit dehydrogenase
MKSLQSATVVITGASSGIGRAAALTFACEGANVVVAARREAALEDLAATCNVASGRALVVPTDVTAPESVVQLARVAAERFGGRIDVWINNAGVGAVGEFTEIPIETHARVIQTNLLGYLHGAHAVLPYFKRQEHGVLINTISLGGWVAAPYAVAYSASKFGLRGYSEALRAELRRWPDIHVCDVFPAFIDTPGFQHGANYFGREIKPVPPVYEPERVATAMVSLAKRPRASTTVGASAYIARLAHACLGARTSSLMEMFMSRYLAKAKAAPVGDGDLFEPHSHGGQVSGGWR